MFKRLFLFSLLITAVGVFAQDKGTITGKILDLEEHNEPMPFANVQLKGQQINAQTNFHGNFELKNIVPGEYTLVISYSGYVNLEIPVLIENNKISKVQGGLYHKTISLEAYPEVISERKEASISTRLE